MKRLTLVQCSALVTFVGATATSAAIWSDYLQPYDCIPEEFDCTRDRTPLFYLILVAGSLAVVLFAALFVRGKAGQVVIGVLGTLSLLVDAYSLVRVF